MTTIEGKRFLTLTLTENEVYKLQYPKGSRINILNKSDGDLLVSTDGTFTSANGVGTYMTLPTATAANNIFMPMTTTTPNEIYIKSPSGGEITIERCG